MVFDQKTPAAVPQATRTQSLNEWLKNSATVKFVAISFLALLLLIPQSMTISLIDERQSLREKAVEEISGKWGSSQTIGAVVLSVPYYETVSHEGVKKTTLLGYAHFLPEKLDIHCTMVPEKRYRGIYVAVLYNSRIHITGSYSGFDVEKLNIPSATIQFDKAILSLGITDLIGLKENVSVNINGVEHQCNPGIETSDIFSSGVSTPLSVDPKASYNFSCDIDLNGSQSLSFLPFGKETGVTVKAPWGDPSFEGSFLPDKREVTPNDFSATWKVLHLNRNYPQQGLGSFITSRRTSVPEEGRDVREKNNESVFGVRLMLPVDEYQKTTRTAKYGVMFICLTFLTLFFVEIFSKKLIHPIQYLIIGFAVLLFYVLLLSISEQLDFGWAYLIASLAILSLNTYYTYNIIRSGRIASLVTMILGVLYVFFYSLLQLHDYSLLLGSIGLLLVLAIVMHLTRHVDWYNIKRE